jgi:N-acetylneuraminic acid mutarotase
MGNRWKFSVAGGWRILALALCVWLTPAGTANAQKWSTLAVFPEPSEELYGITTGGKLYVFGGQQLGWKSLGMVYEYDPATDFWTKKKDMPLPAHHAALAEHNGKIYVIGGFVVPRSAQQANPPGWEPIDNVWEYDPRGDAWRALAPLPSNRGSAVAGVVDGKIFAIGGAANHPGSKESYIDRTRGRPSLHRAVATNEVYDPATNRWDSRNPMPTARNHSAIGVVNGRIYVIGGRIGSVFMSTGSNTDIVEEYDPATDQWGGIRAPMPTPRSGGAWGVHNGRIYFAGGEGRSYQFSAAFKAVEAYDPVGNAWTVLPPMQVQRHGLAGAFIGNRLHLVSGVIQSQSPLPGTNIATDIHEVLDLAPGNR